MSDEVVDPGDETTWKIVAGHVGMLSELAAQVRSGTDPDEALLRHDILHAFADEISDISVEKQLVVPAGMRGSVAASVLEDMAEVLGAALADYQRGVGVDFGDLSEDMSDLFRELSGCIPESVLKAQQAGKLIDNWMEQHPEVGVVMIEETAGSALEPYELLAALQHWMSELDEDDRIDLSRRFSEEPAAVVREALRRAELIRQLDGPVPKDTED